MSIISLDVLKMLIPVLILLGLGYGLLYKKYNRDTGIIGYFSAFLSYINLLVVMLFIVVGIFIIYLCIKEKQYLGLIIPIVWYLICYTHIKVILHRDFNINIRIIRSISMIENFEKFKKLFFIVFFAGGFIFASIMCFWASFDTNNQPYGPMPLIIVGIMFLSVGIGSILMFLKPHFKIKSFFSQEKIGSFIFLMAGLCFTALFTSIYFAENNFKKDAIKTSGTITNIEVHNNGDDVSHTVYVQYTVDDEVINGVLPSYDSSMKIGKLIDIYYDENNIYNIMSDTSDFVFLIFVPFSMIFVIIGFIGIIKKTNSYL